MHHKTSSTPALSALAESLFPSLSHLSHKGQSGRLLVIGGSIEYTGAPYFAAISALKLGADLVHVFCPQSASIVIKSYSPELIVHPLLDDKEKAGEMDGWLSRMHSVVVGPGLGSDEQALNTAESLVKKIQALGLPLIIDADGLRLVAREPSLITNQTKTTITPNVVEFGRIAKSLNLQLEGTDDVTATQQMASLLGNVTVIRKGLHDVISDGNNVVVVDEGGSTRRCGGQGDVLSGFAAAFACWTHQKSSISATSTEDSHTELWNRLKAGVSGGMAACIMTRRCASNAFMTMGRSMLTTDMIGRIPQVVSPYGRLK